MVLHLLEKGIEVVVWNRSPEPKEQLKQEAGQLKSGSENLTATSSLDELIGSLESPRVIWLMVTAGPAIDELLTQLAEKLDKDDLVIDGGNSLYKETLRRNEILSAKGIHFMDAGTSGGIEGARGGACIMVGGLREDFEKI